MSEYIVTPDTGTKCWLKNGILHRDDGPALEYTNGTRRWYKNGVTHREDGPAVEWSSGSVAYWIDGVQLTNLEVFVKFGVAND